MSQTTSIPPTCRPVVWDNPQRGTQFKHWLANISKQHALNPDTLHLASADASFRRYFRLSDANGSRIIVDAPPEHENNRAFVQIAKIMRQARLRVPEVLAWDEPLGFMLLSDLGQQTMMQAINPRQPQAAFPLYLQAIDALILWQLASKPNILAPYNEALLRRELELFVDWYLVQNKGLTINQDIRLALDNSFKQIISVNLNQPQVFVHRDFMPRNLMMPKNLETWFSCNDETILGVLDFQDAVYGPISYDIASLIRDAFLSWDEEFCLDITVRYWKQARQISLPVANDFGEFYRNMEWMGLQRHLKIAGIFSRLTLRDNKPQYLADAPRFINYIHKTCIRYRELRPLLTLIEKVEGITNSNIFGFGRQI